MIIYGWNTKTIKEASLDNYECPNCNQKQSVLLLFARYVHIFWIPVFPYKKSAVIVCAHCKKETDEKGIGAATGVDVKQLKSTVPLPKYLFSGLAVIAAGVLFLTYSRFEKSRKEESYIKEPRVGDVYIFRDNEESSAYKYYLLKVRVVTEDSLWVSSSSYNYNRLVSTLDPNDGFYDVMYTMHKNNIKVLNESGELKSVLRDYPTSAGFDRDIEFEEPIEEEE